MIATDAAVALEKSLRLPPTNPRYQIATRQVQKRLKRENWRESASQRRRATVIQDEPVDKFPPPTTAPWEWGTGSWTVCLGLLRGSTRNHSEEIRREDAQATILSYRPLDRIIFTDGSVLNGTDEGGAAAVIYRFDPGASPALIDCVGRRGARLSSSFDAEVIALRLATEWLIQHTTSGKSLICTDSQAVLTALKSGKSGTSLALHELRSRLGLVSGEVILQWVPGHCGLAGNELADQAANHARSADGPRTGISYGAAKSYWRRMIRDPPPSHHRTRMVYGDGPPRPCNNPNAGPPLTKREAVILARLRSGHSFILAAYRHQIGKSPSPTCPKCEEEEESLEHWFQRCPATLHKRVLCFGLGVPPLSLLRTDVSAVTSYLRSLKLL